MSNIGQLALDIVGAAAAAAILIVSDGAAAPLAASVFSAAVVAGNLIFPNINAPQHQDLQTTTSSIGVPVQKVFGISIVPGTVIWIGPVVTVDQSKKQSKKSGGADVPTYYQSIAIGLCETAQTVRRIWENGKLVYDARPQQVPADVGGTTYLGTWDAKYNQPPLTSGQGQTGGYYQVTNSGTTYLDGVTNWYGGEFVVFTGLVWVKVESDTDYAGRLKAKVAYEATFILHTGTETQLPDTTIESIEGVGNVSGYRGLMYIVYPHRLLQPAQGLRHPTWKFEVESLPTQVLVVKPVYLPGITYTNFLSSSPTFSPDGSRYYFYALYVGPGGRETGAIIGFYTATNTQFGLFSGDNVVGDPTGLAPGFSGFSSQGFSVLPDYTVQFSGSLSYEGNSRVFSIDPTLTTYTEIYPNVSMVDGVWTTVVWTNTTPPILGGPALGAVITDYAGMWVQQLNGAYGNTVYMGINQGLAFAFTPPGNTSRVCNLPDEHSANGPGQVGVFWVLSYAASGGFHGSYPPVITFNKVIYDPYGITGISNTTTLDLSTLDPTITNINTVSDPLYSQETGDLVFPTQCFTTAGFRGYVISIDPVTLAVRWNLSSANGVGASSAAISNTAGNYTYTVGGFYLAQTDLSTGATVTTDITAAYTAADVVGNAAGDHGAYSSAIGALVYIDYYGQGPVVVFPNAISPNGQVSLATIVRDTCETAGMTDSQIDVTDLETLFVQGYVRSRLLTARDFIMPLRSIGFFDVVESGEILKFVARGKAVVATIPASDLGVYEDGQQPVPLVTTAKTQDVDLPRQLRVHYLSPMQDYQSAEAQSPVRISGSAVNDVDIELVASISDAQAIAIAEVLWTETWNGRWAHTLQLDQSYQFLEPSDCVIVPVDGRNYRMRITSINDTIPYLRQVSLVRDDDQAYVSTPLTEINTPVIGGASGGGGSQQLSIYNQTYLVLLDSPMIAGTTADNDAGVYAAVAPVGTGNQWIGTAIQQSTSENGDFSTIASTSVTSTIGTVVAPIPAGDSTIFDNQDTLTVNLVSGSLMSDSSSGVLSGANEAAVGTNGRWELIQFTSAVKTSGVTWQLSGLLRGRRGTEHVMGSSQAGDLFVLLDKSVFRVPLDPTKIGVPYYYRTVSPNGAGVNIPVAFPYASTGEALRPFSPVDFVEVKDPISGDINFTWIRRSRIGQELPSGTDIPLGEAAEVYSLDIGHPGSVVRTFNNLTSPTATYSVAQQTADYGSSQASVFATIYQISEVLGRGTGRNTDGSEVTTGGDGGLTAPPPPPLTPLDAPTGLKATTVTSVSVVLVWDSVNYATSYNLRKKGTIIAYNLSALTYTDNSVTAGQTIQYQISANDVYGEGTASAPLTVITLGTSTSPTSDPGTYPPGTGNGSNYDGTATVANGRIVNSSGTPIIPIGCNFSGLESCGAQGQAPWYGNDPDYATYHTWNPNFARIPLNAASILGLNCRVINSTGNGWVGGASNADPTGTYLAKLDAAIAAFQAEGCYVILDMHWTAPQFTLGGVTAYAMPLWQSGFLDLTAKAAWSVLINRYGTQATPKTGIDNHGILFEPHNEPFLNTMGFSGTTLYNTMKSGGTGSYFSTNGSTSNVAQSWTIVGYQDIIDLCTTAGANNVCICNGYSYAHSLQYILNILPTDSRNQLAIGWHPYPLGTYPNSGGYQFPGTYPDPGYATVDFGQWAQAVLDAGYPIIITEDGGQYGPTATSGEPHVDFVTSWAYSKGIGYISWEFWAPVSATSNGNNNLLTTAKNPTIGQGVATYNFFKSLPVNSSTSGATVPSQPVISGVTAGDSSVSVAFGETLNGGSAITEYTVTDQSGVHVGTGVASPVTVNGLTNGVAYQFYLTATNSIGTSAKSALSASVTPTGAIVATNLTLLKTMWSFFAAKGNAACVATEVITTAGGYTAYFNNASSATENFQTHLLILKGSVSVVQTIDGEGPNPPSTSSPSLSTTFANKVTAGNSLLGFSTCSTAGGSVTSAGVTDAETNTFTNLASTSQLGVPSSARQLDSWYVHAVGGDSVNPDAITSTYAGPDLTKRAQFMLEVNGVTSVIGTSKNIQTGVAPGTNNVNSGLVTVGSGDVPCIAIAISFNVSQLGTTVTPTVGTGVGTGSSPTKPAPCTSLVAVGGPQEATVSFTPGSDGGDTIDYFTVTANPTGIQATGNGSPITVPLTVVENYNFTVTATNAVGTSNPSAPSNTVAVTAAVSGGSTSVTSLQMTLQGQIAANSASSPPLPSAPNSLSIAWPAVSGATSYKVYRSVNGGSYFFYATTTFPSFMDTAATTCVGSNSTASPAYNANTYRYKISSIVGGVESAQSNSQSFEHFNNGVLNGIGGNFNSGVTENDSATTSPLSGNSKFIRIVQTSNYGFWLPYSGNHATEWNLWVGAFNYFNFWVRVTSGVDLKMFCLRAGDKNIYLSSAGQTRSVHLNAYATIVPGTWTNIIIPKGDLLLDYGPGGGSTAVMQNAFYKFGMQDNNNSFGTWDFDKAFWTP